MLASQFHEAAAAARNSAVVDETARLLWRAHAEGHIDDADAEAVSEALQARRATLAATGRRAQPTPALGPPRRAKPPRSSDRQASLERRRRQAMSGAVPSPIAASFTMGELAVLTVVARQTQRSGGVCVLPIDAIAALAGVSRSTAKNALRLARRMGLIEVRERRRRGLPSLPNVVRIISPEWSGWLRLSGQKVGVRNLTPTGNSFLPRGGGGDFAGRKRPEACSSTPSRSGRPSPAS